MNKGALSKIVLADDHPIVLSGLKSLINTDPSFEIAALCDNGLSAYSAIQTLKPDVAVLDISMPGMTGLEVLECVAAERLQTRIVLLTASATDEQVVSAVARGARGMMLKDAAPDALLDCLHAVSVGGRWLPPDLVNAALERESGRRIEADRIETELTRRERELVGLVAEGLSNKEVGRKLGITEGTVKIHLHNIYQKLGVQNRTALTAFAFTYRNRLTG